jgi:hypothetical protein
LHRRLPLEPELRRVRMKTQRLDSFENLLRHPAWVDGRALPPSEWQVHFIVLFLHRELRLS